MIAAKASVPVFKNPYSQPSRVALQAGSEIVISAVRVPIMVVLLASVKVVLLVIAA